MPLTLQHIDVWKRIILRSLAKSFPYQLICLVLLDHLEWLARILPCSISTCRCSIQSKLVYLIKTITRRYLHLAIIEWIVALIAFSTSLRVKSKLFVVAYCTNTFLLVYSFIHSTMVIFIILSLPPTFIEFLHQSLFIWVFGRLSRYHLWDCPRILESRRLLSIEHILSLFVCLG